jgi:arogenate dehydrogenase (NADP+), plant
MDAQLLHASCMLSLYSCTLSMQVDILCTHPMFGPDSGKGSWAGLKFMYEKVRVGSGERRQRRADQFLQVRQARVCSW